MTLKRSKVKAGELYGSLYIITVFKDKYGSKALCWCRDFLTYGIAYTSAISQGKTRSGRAWQGRKLPDGLIVDAHLKDIARRDHSWNVSSNGYAVSTQGVFFHRYIYELVSQSKIPADLEVDHINGNRLDNRFENFRLVTRRQNMLNSKVKQGVKSQYRGVYYSKKNKGWIARHTVFGESIWIGSFPTQESAYTARKEYIQKHYPEDFAYLRN